MSTTAIPRSGERSSTSDKQERLLQDTMKVMEKSVSKMTRSEFKKFSAKVKEIANR